MAFDFKKEYRELYHRGVDRIIDVPRMNFLAVRAGDLTRKMASMLAVTLLYAVAYTLRMSYKSDYRIEGFYEYVVPPLEGLWQQKALSMPIRALSVVSLIRLPDLSKRPTCLGDDGSRP